MINIHTLLTKILQFIGNTSMGTTATTITGAIAELKNNDLTSGGTVNGNLSVTGTLNSTGTLSQGGTAVSLSGHKHSASDLTSGGTIGGNTSVSGTLDTTGAVTFGGAIHGKNGTSTIKLFATGSASGTATIASGNNNLYSLDITKTGYTPMAVKGVTSTSAASNIYQFWIDGNTLKVRVKNNYSTSLSITITGYVLYVASSAL